MTLYDVVEVDELPTFDATKMIKHVLLSPANAQLVSQITRKYGRVITLSYYLGAVLYPFVLFTPSRVGQIVALIETALEFPSYIRVLMALRADIVLLLVTSYDFWFFTATTVIFSFTFSLLFRDLRVVLTVMRCIGFQMIILIDANAYQPRSLVLGAMLNLAMATLNTVAVSLDAVADTWRPEARDYQAHPTISIRDLLVNSLVTMGILLLRLVYNKRQLIRSVKRTSDKKRHSVVQCVTLRCSLKLRVMTEPSESTHNRPCPAQTHPVNRVKMQRVVNEAMVYESTETIADSLSLPQLRLCRHTSTRILGAVGGVLTSACSIVMFSTTDVKPPVAVIVLSISALLTTASYVGVTFLHCNRRLLIHICRTFDFVFLSIQITMAHVCIAHMLQWRVLAITTFGCSWLWIHWVLVLDAMLPDTKNRIGLVSYRTMGLAVLGAYFSAHVAVLLIGLFWSGWELRNRVFLSIDLLGFKLAFRVLPFFISRMMTVTLWTLRLLWRYYHQDDSGKLIMLRGQVEFEYEHKGKPTLTSVVPMATSPTETYHGSAS